jgi:hypothetical protein
MNMLEGACGLGRLRAGCPGHGVLDWGEDQGGAVGGVEFHDAFGVGGVGEGVVDAVVAAEGGGVRVEDEFAGFGGGDGEWEAEDGFGDGEVEDEDETGAFGAEDFAIVVDPELFCGSGRMRRGVGI